MKKLKLSFLFALTIGSAMAQSQYEPCGQVGYIDYLEKQYPGFKTSVDEQYNNGLSSTIERKLSKRSFGDTIFRIPVVFHVVYGNNLENIHDSLLISQIRILNEAYRRQNPDTIKTRDIFKPVAADAGIEFFLAKMDPFGNPTNGITRTATTETSFYRANGHTDEMKYDATGGKNNWDPNRYLNIWVCDLSNGGVDQLLGYAFPPTNAQNWNATSFVATERQGVVLHYKVVGDKNILNKTTFSKGRTAVHEVGHYLGLRHTWGDAVSGFNGCLVDDNMDDTPNTYSANTGCNYGRNSCSQSVPGDLPDQAENYMDYTNDSCMNMFTIKQVSMMRFNLDRLRSSVAEKYVIPMPQKEIERMVLFPNPANNHIVLEWNYAAKDKMYKVIVTDLIGQTVMEEKSLLETTNEYQLNHLSGGMYFFQLFDEGNKSIFFQKLMIINN